MTLSAFPRFLVKSLVLTIAAYLSVGAANAGGNLHEVTGSGVIEEQNRGTGHYDKVVIDLPYVVELQFGKSEMVTVITDDNLQSFIDATVKDHVLHISLADPTTCIHATTLTLALEARHLGDISLAGGAAIRAAGLTIGDPGKVAATCRQ